MDIRNEIKLTAKQFVESQVVLRAEPGQGFSVEYGRFAESTIRRAINRIGYRAEMDDCGNMYAIVPGNK